LIVHVRFLTYKILVPLCRGLKAEANGIYYVIFGEDVKNDKILKMVPCRRGRKAESNGIWYKAFGERKFRVIFWGF
jgi:hypothetical protein